MEIFYVCYPLYWVSNQLQESVCFLIAYMLPLSLSMCFLCFIFYWCDVLLICHQTTLQWEILIHFIPFCFPSVNFPPVVPCYVLSTLIFYSLSLTHSRIRLHSRSSSPSFLPFISRLSSLMVFHIPLFPSCFFLSPISFLCQ